jgi:hypothetical protein
MIIVWLSCAFSNDCSKPFKIKAEYLNKRLNGHTIVELEVQNLHMCAREFISISMCKSMAYFHGKRKLNDADRKSVLLEDFEDKLGAIFCDISDWKFVSISFDSKSTSTAELNIF